MAISEQVVSTLSNAQLSQNTFVSFLVGNVLGFCRNENAYGKCLLWFHYFGSKIDTISISE